MTEQRAKNFTLSLFSFLVHRSPPSTDHGRHPRISVEGSEVETVCSRVKTPSGRPNSPLSSPRTFTRTFHVCWLRVEAWIISAHAQLRASRRRVKTIPTVALRSVRRGTWSRTVLFILLDIILPVSACSPVQVVFLRIRFVCFLFRAFLIREIGDCLSGDCVEFKKWVLKST